MQRHIFSIEHRSEIDDRTYTGDFSCKKLSVRDFAQLSVVKCKLNGGLYYDAEKPGFGVDENTDDFNHMLAHLQLAVIDTPEWWDLDQIGDIALVALVFKEVASFENSFHQRGQADSSDGGQSTGRSQAGSQKAVSSADSGRVVATVVDKEVQSSLEP